MAADDIDGVFLPIPVKPSRADFCAFMDYVATNPWLDAAGFSVTLPHKQHALHWLAAHDQPQSPLAARCGAVNTLTRTPQDVWQGENTDAPGLLAALETTPELSGGQLNGLAADVLGAGGAARAAAAALLERGCKVTIYNRSPDRASALAADLGCAHAPWENRAHGHGEVLINCTSVGLWPNVDDSPVPSERLTSDLVVLDTVYNPPHTRLLNEAAQRGCRTISGIEMFIGQAAQQHAQWHGRPAPTAVMRSRLSATDHPV
jgi:3-dehydroquinate dehydratase/shikimate dehydrogenase